MSDGSTRPFMVVNADDLGLTESATAGILRAHERGVVTSASFAVVTPAAEHAAESLTRHPRLGIGLHFCLTAGRPAANPKDVPLLVNEDGYLRWRFASLLLALSRGPRNSLLAQIALELEAQIARAKAFGVALDHINGERHVHLLPGVFERVASAARHHGIPHVRLINEVGSRYVPIADKLAAVVNGGWPKVLLLTHLTRRARRVCTLEGPRQVGYATLLCTGQMYKVMPAIWENPPEGVTEIAVHPGLPEVKSSATGNTSLSAYLASPQRRTATEACEELRLVDTAASLTTFGQAYRAGGPLSDARGRPRSRPTA